MLNIFRYWYDKYFASEEVVVLLLLIIGSTLFIAMLGRILAPVFTALVVAYLLQGLVSNLVRNRIPKVMAILCVYLMFIGLLLATIFILLPMTWGQLIHFVDEQLPRLLLEGQSLFQLLPQKYPEMISQTQANEWVGNIKKTLNALADDVVSFSFALLPNLMGILIFLVLVPVLVFFFLKDKEILVRYFLSWLPEDRAMLSQVWSEMNQQVSNYIRGKCVEILIVGSISYVAWVFLDLDYAVLLAMLVGFSVLIPYIGAAVATFPVALVGYFQFGFGSEWITLMVVYGVIQAVDGNVLVPLLFSEAVNLHPVSIIVAVLLFGGLWGLWGVFFAIPLATLIKSVANAWSSHIRQLNKISDEVSSQAVSTE